MGVAIVLLPGCPFFSSNDTSDLPQTSVTQKEKDAAGNLTLALGGVREATDIVTINQALKLLDFATDDGDLFSMEVPNGKASYTEALGVRVLPKQEGIGYLTPKIDARAFAPIQVTIPPQQLIQILLGEARTELTTEATLDSDGNVKVSSVSVTGDAIGAVIRNRVDLINEQEKPSLFVADPDVYASNPPVSYYDAIIEANNGTIHQFSPVDPEDPSHDEFLDAANRGDLSKSLRKAYDQAVLTAAGIFNGETDDPTGGAFGFYSPTADQFELLQEALDSEAESLPEGCGTSNANFPALTPVQVVILKEIAPSSTVVDTPSFVFVRTRSPKEPAVVDSL